VCLAQPNAVGVLLDLQSKVGYLELLLHLLLKPHDLIHHRPGDDEIIDIHVDDELVTSLPASVVDGVLVLTLAEPKFS
jgi:hypothetical protein